MKGIRILPAPRAEWVDADGNPCRYEDRTVEQEIAASELVAKYSSYKDVRRRAAARAEGLKSGDIPWPPCE